MAVKLKSPIRGAAVRSRTLKVAVKAQAGRHQLENAELQYFSQRVGHIHKHFPNALSADDFLARAEIALCAHGIRGDNSLACTNLCRDEATGILKRKIDDLFGSSFNTNGLGGVLTCGCTGIKAGLSHSPVCNSGRERYVFFSFPHIGVDADGTVGAIDRPGRPNKSRACGAFIEALSHIQQTGLDAQIKEPGVHDPKDPEFSILKQRLARRIAFEKLDEQKMGLVDITMVAERMITGDLEYLISEVVDTDKAEYAVLTGVQIHNWGPVDSDAPTLEFVMPTQAYLVVNGVRTDLDLLAVPALTPRQMAIIANATSPSNIAGAFLKGTTIVETAQEDPAARVFQQAAKFSHLNRQMAPSRQVVHNVPVWASSFAKRAEHAVPCGSNMVPAKFRREQNGSPALVK